MCEERGSVRFVMAYANMLKNMPQYEAVDQLYYWIRNPDDDSVYDFGFYFLNFQS